MFFTRTNEQTNRKNVNTFAVAVLLGVVVAAAIVVVVVSLFLI